MLRGKFDGFADCEAVLLAILPQLIIHAHHDPGAREILVRNHSLRLLGLPSFFFSFFFISSATKSNWIEIAVGQGSVVQNQSPFSCSFKCLPSKELCKLTRRCVPHAQQNNRDEQI